MSPRADARGRRIRLAVILCTALAAGLIAWSIAARPGAATLEPPPDSARQSAAIREHLQQAFAAARQAPSSPAAVAAYCVALHADMFYEAAGTCYQELIELDPREWRWTYYRSLLRGDLGDAAGVAQDLRRVVSIETGFSPAWLRLGDAEFKVGRYQDADAAWRRAVALPEPERIASPPVLRAIEVPAASYASLGLARISLMRGDSTGARDILEALVAKGPPFGSAYRILAEIHAANGREVDATRARARAQRLPSFVPYADPVVDRLALESRNSTLLLRLASEADLAVNGAWSAYLTRRAIGFDPDNPEVVLKLARVLRTIGQTQESLTYFRRYQALVPGDPQVLAHLGSALSELGRFSEAEPLLRQAVAAQDDAVTHYNLGLLLAVTGRVDEAVVEYERALDRDARDINARINLAAALARKGQLDRAGQELTHVLDLDPENALARTNLGLVRLQRGDIARARLDFHEALRLDPGLTRAAEALRLVERQQ